MVTYFCKFFGEVSDDCQLLQGFAHASRDLFYYFFTNGGAVLKTDNLELTFEEITKVLDTSFKTKLGLELGRTAAKLDALEIQVRAC
jgi:hypothetical protein